MTNSDIRTFLAGAETARPSRDADPITTEVVRHALISATKLMKVTLCRTAFSPTIYEHLDFACALYDRNIRLLAQAPSLPIFLGTLNFCVDAVVRATGGAENLVPGDILLTTYGFDTGSHSQDAALVMPAFCEDELIGYAVIKAHWADIAAKDPYCTDTVDNFQEGTIYPGIRIYRAGRLQEDLYRTVLANSRFPERLVGDFNAQVNGLRAGVTAFCGIVENHGVETFNSSIERMFDHGEEIVRRKFAQIPDGRYLARGIMDDNGVSDDPIPFDITVEVRGSDVLVDYAAAPPQQPGPVNCPLPATVSASRVAICAIAGVGETSHEGHFRPIKVRVRKGTLFDPNPPAPIFLYGWPMFQAIEVICLAIAKAMPTAVPGGSGGDICGVNWWGEEQDGEKWYQAGPHVVGQGGSAHADGANALMHIGTAATGETPIELWEARYPVQIDKWELAADSAGSGRHRGGLGVDFDIRMLRDCYITATFERTKNPGWGLEGGKPGRKNALWVEFPDGSKTEFAKATRVPIPAGSVMAFRTGGGGGWGKPVDRDPEKIHEDITNGYMTEERCREEYPHVFAEAQENTRINGTLVD